MIPLYHQLEAVVLAVMAFRGGMSIYLLKVALDASVVIPASVSDQDKATVLVLCIYRALRTWGDCHGVSVHQTLQQRRRRAKMNKLWMDEYQHRLEEHRARLAVRIQHMVDTRAPQLFFLMATLAYCWAEFYDFVQTSRVLGYVLLFAFGCEFLIRTKAQGGEIFFRPLFNKLEFCILSAGTWCLFYASWYTQYLAASKDEATAVATATAVLLLLHRCIRMLGIQLKACLGRGHSHIPLHSKPCLIISRSCPYMCMGDANHFCMVPRTVHPGDPSGYPHFGKPDWSFILR